MPSSRKVKLLNAVGIRVGRTGRLRVQRSRRSRRRRDGSGAVDVRQRNEEQMRRTEDKTRRFARGTR